MVKDKVLQLLADKKISKYEAKELIKEINNAEQRLSSSKEEEEIAIIGYSGVFPGAQEMDGFFRNLLSGKCAVDYTPKERLKIARIFSERSSFKGAWLERIDQFDYEFFGLSKAEAIKMDPHQRIMLEKAYECFELGGYTGTRLHGRKIGVFTSHFNSEYFNYNPDKDAESALGNSTAIGASRISHVFNLKGPALSVNTECSSALVSVHMACQSLKYRDCDLALAGGINLKVFPVRSDLMNITSSDGRTKPFDNSAEGTNWGEGGGFVLLKPNGQALKDKDSIHGVIKGSAINQNSKSSNIAYPNQQSQEEVLQEAWFRAKVDPKEISYIETHGTGTKVGDPIEVRAITKAFKKYLTVKNSCAIGSVKGNVNHLAYAAGMPGLIKIILSLKNQVIPPTTNINMLNDLIDFENSPCYVNLKPVQWKKSEIKRKAGISSFGLSGTNCHLIIEEPPIIDDKENDGTISRFIFTLSANSQYSFYEKIQKTLSFLKEDEDHTINEICYTSNLRREHFKKRLAILCSDTKELIKRLEWVSKNIKKFSKEHSADNILDIFCSDILSINKLDTDKLANIANDYVSGKDINWVELYSNVVYENVPLPTYIFEKKSCWLERYDESLNLRPSGLDLNQLKYHKSSAGIDIFHVILDISITWLLNEHRYLDEPLLPGTGLIDLIFEGTNHLEPDNLFEIRNLNFLTPVVCPVDDKVRVEIVFFKLENTYEVKVNSCLYSDSNWVTNAVCTLNIAGIQQKNKNQIVKNIDSFQPIKFNFNDVIKFGPISLGDHWDVIDELKIKENQLYARLKLPDKFTHEVNQFALHPSLLDAAMSLVSFFPDNVKAAYLPFEYGKITYHQNIESEVILVMSKLDSTNNETISVNVEIFNKQLETLISIVNYSIKKVNNHSDVLKNNLLRNKLHSIKWERKDTLDKMSHSNHELLLFSNNKQLINSARQGHDLSLNHIFDGFCSGKYSESLLEKQIESLDFNSVYHIVVNFHSQTGVDQNENLESNLKGLYFLFFLSKKLATLKRHNKLYVTLVANLSQFITNQQDSVYPENNAFLTFGLNLFQELQFINYKGIDYDDNTSPDSIWDEILIMESISKVAYRFNQRYVPYLIEGNYRSDKKVEISSESVVVIIGGAGGIGCKVAKNLINTGAQLILTGRSSEKDLSKEKQKALEELWNLGGKLSYFSANISDYSEMKALFENIEKIYGKVTGVIHAAGLAGDGTLRNKSFSTFRNILSPKVFGTQNLLNLLNDTLDFCVLFSSTSAVVGGFGQSDYSTANAYLDGIADYGNLHDLPIISINWPAWEGTGMAHDIKQDNKDLRIEPIGADDGVKILRAILNSTIKKVIVGKLNYSLVKQEDYLSMPFKIKDIPTKRARTTVNSVVSIKSDDDTQSILIKIWSNLLKTEDIQTDSDYFELGGNSLNGTQLINKIREVFNMELLIDDLFECPTIASLSAFIDLNRSSSAKENKSIPIAPTMTHYPLSFAQERIWIAENSLKHHRMINLVAPYIIKGDLNYEVLNHSIQLVIEKHEILRTKIVMVDGIPVQKIENRIKPYIIKVEKQEGRSIDTILKQELERRYSVLNSNLFDVKIVELENEEQLYILQMHHLISDFYSLLNFNKDVIGAYNNILIDNKKSPIKSLKVQYKDFSAWQRQTLNEDVHQQRLNYWRSIFDGEEAKLNFPEINSNEADDIKSDNVFNFTISQNQIDQLEVIGKKNKFTLSAMFLSAIYILINKLTGQNDFVIGMLTEGREHIDLEEQIGHYVNTLPLRINSEQNISFLSLFNLINKMSLKSKKLEIPFNEIYELKQSHHNKKPLFDVTFNFLSGKSIQDIEMTGVSIEEVTSDLLHILNHEKITFVINKLSEELVCQIIYDKDYFTKDSIQQISDNIVHIISLIIENPHLKLSEVEWNQSEKETEEHESFKRLLIN